MWGNENLYSKNCLEWGLTEPDGKKNSSSSLSMHGIIFPSNTQWVRRHSAATKGVMHLFDQSWWFCLIFWAKWDGLDINRCQKPPKNFLTPRGARGASKWGAARGTVFLKSVFLVFLVTFLQIWAEIDARNLTKSFLNSKGARGHSKLSSIYHMPHHVKKYTNAIRPMVSCIWIKWSPEANKPASFPN